MSEQAAADLALVERLLPTVRGKVPLNEYSTLSPRQFADWLETYKRAGWTGWQREVAESIVHDVAEALRRREGEQI